MATRTATLIIRYKASDGTWKRAEAVRGANGRIRTGYAETEIRLRNATRNPAGQPLRKTLFPAFPHVIEHDGATVLYGFLRRESDKRRIHRAFPILAVSSKFPLRPFDQFHAILTNDLLLIKPSFGNVADLNHLPLALEGKFLRVSGATRERCQPGTAFEFTSAQLSSMSQGEILRQSLCFPLQAREQGRGAVQFLCEFAQRQACILHGQDNPATVHVGEISP